MLTRRALLQAFPAVASGVLLRAQPELPDLTTVPADLRVAPVSLGEPGAGRRVRQTLPEYIGTDVHHLLYLPRDWRPGARYPVIVEYAGNDHFTNPYGDVSTGVVEGSKLGYGFSGGQGFIWISMPYIDLQHRRNQTYWWGDLEATVRYCRDAVRDVCERFGGDTSAVILTGFSRGALACNYVGLHDDRIADLWLAFIPYSLYDGMHEWSYAASDRASALQRLKRLRGRPVFVCQEGTVDDIRLYIQSTGIRAPFTYQRIGFRNHNDAWALRDIPERRALRRWLNDVLDRRPGTVSVAGRVTDAQGRGLPDVRISSGYTHWTGTDVSGAYALTGSIASQRTVLAEKQDCVFHPPVRTVNLSTVPVANVDFRLADYSTSE